MAIKKKKVNITTTGKVFILSTFNNTIITITNDKGDVIVSSSAGACGFKGTKKGTPYAAQIASSTAAKKAVGLGLKQVAVFIKGPGPGREVAIRSLELIGLSIVSIKDITPIPHNGCRPQKRRRV